MKKRFVALVLAMICILMFSGCSSDELSLISALYKDAKMTSVKTTEVLSGNMKITLPQEIMDDMEDYDLNPQSILNMLSSFRLEATSEQQLNGNTATGKYSYAVISDDLNFSGEIYASIDDNHTKTIVKIPTPLKALLPHKYENAIYCTVDTADITDVMMNTFGAYIGIRIFRFIYSKYLSEQKTRKFITLCSAFSALPLSIIVGTASAVINIL